MTGTLDLTIGKQNLLTANQRLHHMQRAAITKVLRHTGAINARSQDLPVFRRAHIIVHIHWPDRRRRDAHNIMPTLKAIIDGVVDAGALPDDDDNHLIGPDLRRAETTSGIPGVTRLVFTFTETT